MQLESVSFKIFGKVARLEERKGSMSQGMVKPLVWEQGIETVCQIEPQYCSMDGLRSFCGLNFELHVWLEES